MGPRKALSCVDYYITYNCCCCCGGGRRFCNCRRDIQCIHRGVLGCVYLFNHYRVLLHVHINWLYTSSVRGSCRCLSKSIKWMRGRSSSRRRRRRRGRGHGSIIIYWKLRFYRELHANDYYLSIVIRFIVPIDLELISYIAQEMGSTDIHTTTL